jgi:hypothetical protein
MIQAVKPACPSVFNKVINFMAKAFLLPERDVCLAGGLGHGSLPYVYFF